MSGAGLALRERLEVLLTRAIRSNPDHQALCRNLAGRLLAVRIQGLERPLHVVVRADGSVALPDTELPAEVTVSGRAPALAAYLLGISPRSSALRDAVQLSGSAQLARQLQELLRGVQCDWEELLARELGDLPARRLAQLARGTAAAARRAGTTLLVNALEHLQYEAALVPSREEWHSFTADLTHLRERLDNAGARLAKLEGRRRPTSGIRRT